MFKALTLQPVFHFIDKAVKHMERRCMVILPIVLRNSALENILVVFSLTNVENIVLISMLLVEKFFHLNHTIQFDKL